MSGIYRGVRLMALSPVHLRDWSVKTTFTDPAKNQAHGKSDANLDITAYVETRALPRQRVANIPVSSYPGVQVKARLVDADGKLIAESRPARFSGQASMYGRQGEKGSATISMRIELDQAGTRTHTHTRTRAHSHTHTRAQAQPQ